MRAIPKSLLALALAGPALTGCDLNSLTDGFARMEGQVVDPQGRPVAGVTVRSYAFLDNLDSLGFESPPAAARNNPESYRVRVDVARLNGPQDRAERVAGEAVTDSNGRYSIESLPLDGLIAIAEARGGSADIRGMDRTTGTVSLSTALRPNRPEGGVGVGNLLDQQLTFVANFVVETPPPQDAEPEPGPDVIEEDDTVDEPLVDPVPEPVAGTWTTFRIDDDGGSVVTDASAGPGSVDVVNPLVRDGAPIRVVGAYSDPGVTNAFLRVQVGGGGDCGALNDAPVRVKNIPVTLQDGKIVSAEGEFQRWHFSGGFEKFQLDLDQEAGNGNESELVSVDAPCVSRSHPMVVNLMWDKPSVDVDLYVWDVANEEPTYQGSYFDGTRGRSSYGGVAVTDSLGHGPEVFQLDAGKNGNYTVRAHVFCGPSEPVGMHARITHWQGGQWQEKTFRGTLNPGSDWLDVGTFAVDRDAP